MASQKTESKTKDSKIKERRKALKREIRGILTEEKKRADDPKQFKSHYEKAEGYRMRIEYELGRRFLEKGRADELYAYAKRVSLTAKGDPDDAYHVFKTVGLLVQAEDGLDVDQLEAVQSSAMCQYYAHTKDVSPDLIVGFIWQHGGARGIKALLRVERPDLFKRSKSTPRRRKPLSARAKAKLGGAKKGRGKRIRVSKKKGI